MAIHADFRSMLQESLPEMLAVAKYSIEFRKDVNLWPAPGCYGFPAALLLLSIADSIGSYVEKGDVPNHFKILNNPDYYGLNLSPDELRKIYNDYRNLLSHNTVMSRSVGLDVGSPNGQVIQYKNGICFLNLVPFYNISVKVVNYFLNNPEVLKNNKTIDNINKK